MALTGTDIVRLKINGTKSLELFMLVFYDLELHKESDLLVFFCLYPFLSAIAFIINVIRLDWNVISRFNL